ncbi:hypothetical protein HaLaN_32074, partial [Haematococcus lacustris]
MQAECRTFRKPLPQDIHEAIVQAVAYGVQAHRRSSQKALSPNRLVVKTHPSTIVVPVLLLLALLAGSITGVLLAANAAQRLDKERIMVGVEKFVDGSAPRLGTYVGGLAQLSTLASFRPEWSFFDDHWYEILTAVVGSVPSEALSVVQHIQLEPFGVLAKLTTLTALPAVGTLGSDLLNTSNPAVRAATLKQVGASCRARQAAGSCGQG